MGDTPPIKAAAPKGAVRAINPLWLFPSAMTLAAFYKDAFEFAGALVAFSDSWRLFARSLWRHLFALLPSNAPISVDDRMLDLLTLWVTCSLVIFLTPWLTGERAAAQRSTVSALRGVLNLPAVAAQILAAVLILASSALIVAPFVGALSSLQTSNILAPGGEAARSWLQGDGRWVSGALVLIGAAAMSYVFFVQSPALAAHDPTPREAVGLRLVSAALWAASAVFLIVAFFLPPDGQPLFGARVTKEDAMVLSLIALAGLVIWRSALPLVQLALLISAIFVIDGAYRFFLDVWRTM